MSPDRVGPVRWVVVGVLAIIAAVLFVGWNDTPEPLSAPEVSRPDTTVGPREDPESLTDHDVGDSEDGTAAALGAVRLLIGQYQVAFVVADGVAIVNPTADHDPVRILTPENVTMDDLLVGFGSFVMFDERGHTYGFKRDDELEDPTVYRLSTQGPIIAGDDSSFAMTVDAATNPAYIYVGNSSGLFMSRLAVPVGAELLNVPSVGVLVISSTGETFVTYQSGFTHFSDWPVIAANAEHHVEIRCGDPLVCGPVLVDRSSGTVSDLPIELAGDLGTVTIAPDGENLLLLNSDTTASATGFIYDVAADELVSLGNEVRGEVAWSPDSSFAAWFDSATTEPRLWVLDVTTAQIDSVDLTDIGAPPRIGEVMLFLP